MVQNCSYDFQVCLRYLCLCSSVPAKIFDYIWNLHNFEDLAKYDDFHTPVHYLSLDGTPPTESDAEGIGIYESMTEDESSQKPQEKHSLVVSPGLEDFCQQLPLWLWLCSNQPFKLASKVPVCDYCIMQRHVWSRFVLPENEFVLTRSLAISKSSSQTSLRQKTKRQDWASWPGSCKDFVSWLGWLGRWCSIFPGPMLDSSLQNVGEFSISKRKSYSNGLLDVKNFMKCLQQHLKSKKNIKKVSNNIKNNIDKTFRQHPSQHLKNI